MFSGKTIISKAFRPGDKKLARAIQFAERNTINDMAFATRRNAIGIIRDKMVLRNKWTEGSIRVKMARRTSDPASVGSFQDYMRDQEFGGTTVRKGQKGVAIPTAYSSGGGQTAIPRRRLPRAHNKLSRIKLRNNGRKGATKAQRNLIAVRQAIKSGRREVYMDTGRSQFIARVTGGKRSPRVRMLYNLTRRSTPIPKNPWLTPATNRAVRGREDFYAKHMRLQMKRLHDR